MVRFIVYIETIRAGMFLLEGGYSLKIGESAEMNNVTAKMLRHYDDDIIRLIIGESIDLPFFCKI